MSELQPFYTLNGKHSSLLIDCTGSAPAILYWGPRIAEAAGAELLAAATSVEPAPARPDKEAPVSLSPEYGAGFPGSAGIQAHRNGRQWAVYSQLESVETGSDGELTLLSHCAGTYLKIVHRLRLDAASDVLVASTEITNAGDADLSVDFCGAPTIPLPESYKQIVGFEGRWSNEFQVRRIERFPGAYLRENRTGRTSHGTFPGVLVHANGTNEQTGPVFALHFGWSGNHRLRIEELPDGRAYAQLGELFFPGELELAPGETYRSPNLFGVHSDNGFSGASQSFHRYVRDNLTASRVKNKPKPVHFNTWEALYFDLSVESLQRLADAAADVGVERFVLDDGWFRNRRSDAAGLGDWFVDETIFPQGLAPLISHVQARGMEFGLWIEPEMVSPDSDLYRAHPEWALNTSPAPLQMARHQLVLDLTRAEVANYLYQRIDALLTEYPIAYLKWDMNRELSQPGGFDGHAVTHTQTLATYALMQRVRAAHPGVEIESCASGGGRADFGVLAHTDRIWTSDNNDAIDRLRIQKGFSFFFPAEVMGSHVGPRDCHITGRRVSMATRAGVAMFGDMGIEANLLELTRTEKAELKAAVELHKRFRQLIFSGDLFRLDMEAWQNGFGIVAVDQREALFSCAVVETPPDNASGRLVLRGLNPNASYRVNVVWPQQFSADAHRDTHSTDGADASGDALMREGIPVTDLRPQELLIFHLQG